MPRDDQRGTLRGELVRARARGKTSIGLVELALRYDAGVEDRAPGLVEVSGAERPADELTADFGLKAYGHGPVEIEDARVGRAPGRGDPHREIGLPTPVLEPADGESAVNA